jgi:hypothetical protein
MKQQTTKQTKTQHQVKTCQKVLNIINVMLWMKKNAYEDSTIKKTAKILRHLQKNCNTIDSEEVKLYIANKSCSNGRKQNLVEAYDKYIKSENLQWEAPFYVRYDKKRKAPREENINFLIDHARMEMSVKLSISKDLGQRPMELTWLTVKDIDLTSGIVLLETMTSEQLQNIWGPDLKLDETEKSSET